MQIIFTSLNSIYCRATYFNLFCSLSSLESGMACAVCRLSSPLDNLTFWILAAPGLSHHNTTHMTPLYYVSLECELKKKPSFVCTPKCKFIWILFLPKLYSLLCRFYFFQVIKCACNLCFRRQLANGAVGPRYREFCENHSIRASPLHLESTIPPHSCKPSAQQGGSAGPRQVYAEKKID